MHGVRRRAVIADSESLPQQTSWSQAELVNGGEPAFVVGERDTSAVVGVVDVHRDDGPQRADVARVTMARPARRAVPPRSGRRDERRPNGSVQPAGRALRHGGLGQVIEGGAVVRELFSPVNDDRALCRAEIDDNARLRAVEVNEWFEAHP